MLPFGLVGKRAQPSPGRCPGGLDCIRQGQGKTAPGGAANPKIRLPALLKGQGDQVAGFAVDDGGQSYGGGRGEIVGDLELHCHHTDLTTE